jgi:enoyl-CoA hydratase
MEFNHIRLETADGVATVTMTREKALNALNRETVRELGQAIDAVRADRSVAALVLTGAGKAFVAGGDIAEMRSLTVEQATQFARDGQAVLFALEQLGIPTLAAVNGFALGGGCELAMACDLIYASTRARFGQPEVNLGVIPGFGGSQRLIRRVGLQRAKELVFTGDIVDAARARELGLVLEVVEPDQLLTHCQSVARKVAQKGRLAVAAAKQVMELGAGLPLAAACAEEAVAFGKLFATQDQREGMTAFVEKRPARFTHS